MYLCVLEVDMSGGKSQHKEDWEGCVHWASKHGTTDVHVELSPNKMLILVNLALVMLHLVNANHW